MIVVGQVEDCGRSSGVDSIFTGGRATETDHCDEEGNVGPAGGSSLRFSQHSHQGIGTTAALPSVPESGKVRRFNSESHRTADGAFQFV